MQGSSAYFLLFCALLALRDALTHFLLHDERQQVSPVLMLFVYCWVATLLAWLFHTLRKGLRNPISIWRGLKPEHRTRFIRLGFATWGVYAGTVWGIYFAGAPVFNVIDYAAMPLITVLAGAVLLKERIERRRILFALVGCAGVALLFVATPKDRPEDSNAPWYLGVLLAFVSAALTSYCSALQKQQVDEKLPPEDRLHPDVVLLFRFPIPAVLMTAWLLVDRPSVSPNTLVSLALIGSIGLFLPLLLLCFGFMWSSLGEFSRFLFLIPVLTWLVVPVLINKELDRMLDWRILTGATLLMGSYLIAEIVEARAQKKAPAGIST